jgi:hypothetical protein
MSPQPTYHLRARGGEELLRDIPTDVGEFRHQALTPDQCRYAIEIAMAQAVWAMFDATGEGHGGYGDLGRWDKWMEGKGAEYAASLELGLPWNATRRSQDQIDGPDLGTNIEVKQTMYPGGGLFIPAQMPDAWWGVLVVGIMPHYVIRGCYHAKTAREHAGWAGVSKNGTRRHLVPVQELQKCRALPGYTDAPVEDT